jgi:2-deoxy-D-gluconate 3-dehydrogenase
MSNPSIGQLFDLSGKVALVTGGSRGIGYGIAARLAEAGAAVMISSVSPDGAELAAAQLRDAGYVAAGVQADAASVEDAVGSVHATVERFGRIDILVNNAGIFPVSPFQQTSEALWDRVLDTNLKGAFFATQAAVQYMTAQGQGGRIINIGSVDSIRPTYAMGHYDASKGGMLMLTKSMALELGPLGITVNMIAPGMVATDGMDTSAQDFGSIFGIDGKESQEIYIQRVPLRRSGQPDDIGKVAVFMAGSGSDYMTGSVIAVDGGLLLA